MTASNSDTIAAISSALGGAIAVIRVSGPAAWAVASAAWRPAGGLARQPVRHLALGHIAAADGAVLDQVAGVRYAAGASYTGEEMVELFTHGGRLAAQCVLRRLLESGARPAEPGEFTRRAFLNGKLDLTQAEAVADILAAQSERSLRVAQRHLAGAFGRRLDAAEAQAEWLLSEMEARLDFPEEALALAEPREIQCRGEELRQMLEGLLATRHTGEILRHGYRVVIAGPPNAGKSSLLNALLGRDRAIVTPIPGTTRDVLEEQLLIRGWPVCLVDTAGLRESADEVETDGIRRAHAALAEADAVLWLRDGALPSDRREPAPDLGATPVIRVLNKMDLAGAADSATGEARVCARTGEGLDALLDRLEERLGAGHEQEPEFAVNERQAARIERARDHAAAALGQVAAERWELAALDWRGCRLELGLITGKTRSPDVLDAVFARFCIGK
ncbi:MAG: tRNA uridine-5-carboxymethylaminomethyl(34) synthesis GTPase MnmE [Lentisphaeria bacterium]